MSQSEKNFDISKIDKNFALADSSGKELVWYDATEEPFALYGLMRTDDDARYCRMPDSVGLDPTINDGVHQLYVHTAGGRLRFATDSPYMALRYTFPHRTRFPHMPFTGSCGFDLYVETEIDSVFLRCMGKGKTGETEVLIPPESLDCKGMKQYTLNFPLYNRVDRLQIGLAPGAKLQEGKKYRYDAPIVFYGSSITQGGCASRPGNAFPSMVARWLDCDHVNLGFSGSGLGEERMMEHIASLHPLIFVYDYDHNAPTPEHLRNTHERGYRIFRKENPTTPVIFVSAPNWEGLHDNIPFKRPVIYETYSKALSEGDTNVAFVDGRSLFAKRDRYASTVDGSHPNDLGMYRMAEAITDAAQEFLRKV